MKGITHNDDKRLAASVSTANGLEHVAGRGCASFHPSRSRVLQRKRTHQHPVGKRIETFSILANQHIASQTVSVAGKLHGNFFFFKTQLLNMTDNYELGVLA